MGAACVQIREMRLQNVTSLGMAVGPRGGIAGVAIAWALLIALALGACSRDDGGLEPPVQATDSAPAWSPTGHEIAYVHFDPNPDLSANASGIYSITFAGGSRLLLQRYGVRSIDWSPDGSRLVFSDPFGLHTIKSNGDSLEQLSTGGSYPRWSPDGQRVSYSAGAALYTIAISDHAIALLSPPGIVCVDGAWSPSGTALVCLCNPNSVGEEVCILTLENGQIRRLTTDNHEDRSPTWARVTNLIAWNEWPTGSSGKVEPSIAVMDTSGFLKQQVVRTTSTPTWNPTGDTLAVAIPTAVGPRIFTLCPDGSGLRQLTY